MIRAGRRALVASTVGAVGTVPHHTEYEMPGDGVLWANGFESAGPYTHPHSFARLPNGNLLAALQRRLCADGVTTGELAELDTAGRVLRAVSAATAVDSTVRPYSLVIVPALDRVVTTATICTSGRQHVPGKRLRAHWGPLRQRRVAPRRHRARRASRRGVRSSMSREGYAGSL